MADISNYLDKLTTADCSNHQHKSNSAVDGTVTVMNGLSLAHVNSASSLAGNSDEIAAAEGADVLSLLASPTTVTSPILIPGSSELSSTVHSAESLSHHHFTPDISYPKSSLGSTPRTSCPGSGHLSSSHMVESYDPIPHVNGSHMDHTTVANGTEYSSNVMPPRSPPDPDLDPEVLGQLLQKHANPALVDKRFSMDDFLKNKARMATAARRELGGHHTTNTDDDMGSCLEDSGHAAELSRQAAHLLSVTESVAEESKVNKDLAALLMERLDSSKKALECLLKLLTCLMEAEQAYSTAMAAAAKAAASGPLAAPADSAGLSKAVEGLVQLPAAAAAGHRQVYLELQVVVDSVRGLWRQYTTTAKDLKQAISTVQRNVDGCCKQLTLSFNEHKAACEAFDASVVYHSAANFSSSSNGTGHQRGHSSSTIEAVADAWTGAAGAAAAALHAASGGNIGGGILRPRFAAAPSRDPWASEGKLVVEQQALQKWQDQEREILQRGFDTLQTLEHDRIAALLKAGDTLAASYCSAVAGLPAAAEGLRDMLTGLHGTGEQGGQHLAQVAADMRSTNQALAARQAESLSNVSQELFCSPEIIRQGPMGLWRPKTSSWENVHFVLTRAGFLHWFRSMEEVAPQEEVPLNLSRCSFEAGQAPAFHLVESGGGSWLVGRGNRKLTVQASSIEECCEWAIALREAIALSSSTGAAAGSSGGGGKQHNRLSLSQR